MINLYNTPIETLSIHRVGNKSRNEAIFLSEQPYSLNDEIVPLIKEYFFKPFREKEENYYQFAHEVDLDYNDMYKYASEIFTNPDPLFKFVLPLNKIISNIFNISMLCSAISVLSSL